MHAYFGVYRFCHIHNMKCDFWLNGVDGPPKMLFEHAHSARAHIIQFWPIVIVVSNVVCFVFLKINIWCRECLLGATTNMRTIRSTAKNWCGFLSYSICRIFQVRHMACMNAVISFLFNFVRFRSSDFFVMPCTRHWRAYQNGNILLLFRHTELKQYLNSIDHNNQSQPSNSQSLLFVMEYRFTFIMEFNWI